ncbi:2,3-dihydro-2,3-dihydroxybenzoate dehydrogenase [Massilia sp. PAMC28688]|uniref:2,3-dihydro-2,3-dihydroxybenzoate dehydrogenase n=1 Tax=Massilia sp. PAMC28688 TaxID=2861283 RepID=UPI001C637AF1|nr:2,3-dihydro-2,3-dihydroxybenzoate dehydrogenase [Massilia sp. PAMC28688]QYF95644.1 2,3-dihydro-2,3-dihydroxybenzoate dehydrogenase [Massilia sp. PAMC28688]
MEFAGKVAIVSGAAQGIGAQVAQSLAAQGARVAALDIQAVEPPPGGIALVVDVADSSAVDGAVVRIEQELGPVDILVNVAGILHLGAALEMSDADWDRTFAVNAGGVFRLCRAVGERMVPRRSGVIVTVASNASSVPRQLMAAYAASKAASTQFTRCLGLELAPFGIRCNVVSPGSTDTAMQRQLWSSPDGEQQVIAGSPHSFRLGIPLGRIASSQDVADAVCFLASQRARHITMHDLRVDGGATLGS